MENENRKAFLLDISLFILDILDVNKLTQENLEKQKIKTLEVPGAFVTMLWAAKAGSTLLQDFIYCHLLLLQQGLLKPKVHSSVMIPEIVEYLKKATSIELRSKANFIVERMSYELARYIDGAPFSSVSEGMPANKESQIRFRRYEPVETISSLDLEKLRKDYTTYYDIYAHPLLDLYFLQVIHAQKIGQAASPTLKRDFIELGREKIKIVAQQIGVILSDFDKIPETKQRYRNALNWFITDYAKEEWRDFLKAGIVEVVLSVATETGIEPISLAAMLIPEVIKGVDKNPFLGEKEKVGCAVVISSALVVACLVLFYNSRIPIFNNKNTPTPFQVEQSTATMPIVLFATSTPDSTTPQAPEYAVSIVTPSITPTALATINFDSNLNYCYYVIQANDTIESISAWFMIDKSELENSNPAIQKGVFTIHQQILVPTSCCRPIGNNGISYMVKRKDTLYSIAKSHLTTVESIANTNRLYDSRYIQEGQMLCIPH